MDPREKEEVRSDIRVAVKDSFSEKGFIIGAVIGIFALWGLGRLTGMDDEALKIFYRNSYTVFFGLSSFVYYKKLKI